MIDISQIEIEGLFGNRNISLPVRNNALVLVGPNGIGKSSVVNIFYYFITRQWSRLLSFEFKSITVVVDGERIFAARDDISGLSNFKSISSSFSPSSRFRLYLEQLFEADLAEAFFSYHEKIPYSERQTYSDALGISPTEVSVFHRNVIRRLLSIEGGELMPRPRLNLERRIAHMIPGRALYLPTYRRIEKDIRDIFPDFEARYRAYTGEPMDLKAGRSAAHYIELVSFGMEDVRENISSKMEDIRDYSLSQYNGLSGKYLRDVIHGKADKYNSNDINAISANLIDEILARVNEDALSADDKDLLREKILSIQGKPKASVDKNERYLARYFTRLMSANEDISTRERDIKGFVRVCNAYLLPTKYMLYDEQNFSVTIHERGGSEIDMSVLSSGEKQIVSIFAHIYLEDVSNQIVVIDEPELSLSVPWHKRFLTDIVASGRCSFLVAVTHSPFIYENELRASASDLRKRTVVTG